MTSGNSYADVDGTESDWDLHIYAIPRDYFDGKHTRINRERATPFLSDIHSRSSFHTVATGEQL